MGITDFHVEAIDKMIELCKNPEQKAGMDMLREMLMDFDEDNWCDLQDSGAEEEWIKQYLN